MNILVFKTNITSEQERDRLGFLLDNESAIAYWNVDLEDCDRVLRIATNHLAPQYIINLTTQAGLQCSELTD